MSRRMIHRRSFLAGTGGAALALPLLQMNARVASGAEPGYAEDGFPLRFIVFFHPNGVWPPTWWPTPGASPTEFTLASSMLPLEPHRDRIVIIDGLDMPSADAGPGEPHQSGMGAVLTGRPLQQGGMVGGDGTLAGWGDGISVDQELAAAIGGESSFASLELGVRASAFGGGEVRSRMVYAGPAQPLSPDDDPLSVWSRVFADLTLSPSEMAELRARRLSILDTVEGQFAALEARAGAQDRERLQQHADLVRDLEGRLQNEAVLGEACEVPGAPPGTAPDDANTMHLVSQQQLDLLVMALACDVTRVASIQYSNGKNHTQFPWISSMGDGHELSHAGDTDSVAWAEWSTRETWYAEQFAYLLGKLAAIPEGASTMLDHTLILWANELGQGNTHSHNRMPFVLAGSAGGTIETGRLLVYDHQSHNDLLVSILNAFGVPATTFGAPEHCTGPLAGLL